MLSHFSHIQLFVTLQTVACQAPLSIGFSRQGYWSGLPCSPPGDLSDPGIELTVLTSPAVAGRFFTTSATWEAPGVRWLSGKEPSCNAGDVGDMVSIPEPGRSSGGGNGNSLQYSCLKNSVDREPGGLPSMGSQRVRHNWAHSTSSQHVDVFTNLEALQALFRDFYGDFIARVWLVKSLAIGDWTSSLAHLLNPLQRLRRWGGSEVPTLSSRLGLSGGHSWSWSYPEVHKDSPNEHKLDYGWKGLVMNNKRHSVTQKIPRVLGTLCQEGVEKGTKTKHMFPIAS